MNVSTHDSPSVLQVEAISAGYAQSQVLFGISLEVHAGEIVALLGRNGMGKTTLLKTVMGYLRPMSGRVVFLGQDATAASPENVVRMGVGYVPQEHNIFESLTVQENLDLGKMASRDRAETDGIDEIVGIFPRLGERLGQRAGTLSGGERKMLAIARALLGNPTLLILDEPTEGLWPAVVEEIAERLQALGQSHSILIVEQHLQMVLRLSQRAYVLERGHVVLEGLSPEVNQSPELFKYLAP